MYNDLTDFYQNSNDDNDDTHNLPTCFNSKWSYFVDPVCGH